MKHITISFGPKELELYEWFLSLTKRWSDKSFFGREAIECYRLFGGSITEAQLARQALAYLKERYPMQWQDILDGKEFSE